MVGLNARSASENGCVHFPSGSSWEESPAVCCGLLRGDNRVQRAMHCLWTLPSGNGLLTFTISWLKRVTLLFLSSQGTGRYDSLICSEADEAAVMTTVTQLLVEIVSKAKKT